jgi:hypothetical protein
MESEGRPSRVRSNGTEEAGRGDAVRLRTGGTLRRVDGVARSEARISPRHGCRPPSGGQHLVIQGERVSAKRGEPHDRQRDATSPQTFARRKPSRWCKTTRAERGWTGGAVGPKGVTGQPGAPGKWTRRGHVGGGAVRSRTPGEAGPMAPGQTLRLLVGSAARARLPCGRFIGDALAGATSRVRGNGQGVPTTDGSPSRSDAPVLSSRAPDR